MGKQRLRTDFKSFRPNRRIAAGAARRWNDRRPSTSRRGLVHVGIDIGGRTDHAIAARQLIAEIVLGGCAPLRLMRIARRPAIRAGFRIEFGRSRLFSGAIGRIRTRLANAGRRERQHTRRGDCNRPGAHGILQFVSGANERSAVAVPVADVQPARARRGVAASLSFPNRTGVELPRGGIGRRSMTYTPDCPPTHLASRAQGNSGRQPRRRAPGANHN